MLPSEILGLNARSKMYTYRYNSPEAKKIANSKLKTKRIVRTFHIPVPETYAKFARPEQVIDFDWQKLPDSFALKPNKGFGGEGIIVVKKRAKDGKGWITTGRRRVTVDDLKLHVFDILEGAFSMGNIPDIAYIEEYVGRHKSLRKYSYRGTPDIRVIVFNHVPVMAMLRLPTKESGGRANLHQGAIAVGIDMATGITTKGYWHGEYIKYKPESKRKLHGIKIPNWTKVLEIAVRCQDTTHIGYLGADIVLHPDRGPMVLELNAQPGLQIQLANGVGLKRRLERVQDLEVHGAEHGVRISKVLFAERFSDRVKAEVGIQTIKVLEPVKVYYYKNKQKKEVLARIDTGAFRSSIDSALAEELKLTTPENILWKDRYTYKSASGRQARPVVAIRFIIAGKKISTSASVTDRSELTTKLLIGRNDLSGFLVNPEDIIK